MLGVESMNTWVLSALWVGLALVATLLAIWLHISTALSEIVIGTVAQLAIGASFARGGLLGSTEWITFFLPHHLLPPIPEGDPEKKALEEPTDAEVV
jgi:hypothetical protein